MFRINRIVRTNKVNELVVNSRKRWMNCTIVGP
jgi:hypothetical protein